MEIQELGKDLEVTTQLCFRLLRSAEHVLCADTHSLCAACLLFFRSMLLSFSISECVHVHVCVCVCVCARARLRVPVTSVLMHSHMCGYVQRHAIHDINSVARSQEARVWGAC
jgi:hypothetical protein